MFRDMVDKIREINRRYQKPKIKLTKWTRAILVTLRLYLLFLVALLLYAYALRTL